MFLYKDRSDMRVLTGIQASGDLHLGNLLGAMRPFLSMQEKGDECFIFIANYHALTSVTDAQVLVDNTLKVAMGYLAVGVDPAKSVFFRQSDVPEVCELAWYLSCITPMGVLERCVSYKDKVAQGLSANHGLFGYPLLQAADILIYQSGLVPVGQDQKQHIEVTRDVAVKFNHMYGAEIFKVPESRIRSEVAVVPGLDGRKMSKSYDNTLELFAPANVTKKKIMRIETDSTPMEDAKDPQACMVFALLKLVASQEELSEWEQRYRKGPMGYGDVKKRLAELVNELLEPFRARYAELEKDSDAVEDVLREGGKKARQVACETMEKVRSAVGIVTSASPQRVN
jgi:tryptophanyl-tRNA synthetase